jgi:putative hydrolase of the HAD superfamily
MAGAFGPFFSSADAPATSIGSRLLTPPKEAWLTMLALPHRACHGSAMASAAPDFRHVRDWIFDLDNTLYPADCGIFARIDRRMTEFVSQHLCLPMAAAKQVQKDLYRAHGTTLNGLIVRHGIDPELYLEYVHDIDLSDLVPDHGLSRAIERLPGRRFVFTNGCRNHAGRILARLGLTGLFDAVWDIRTIEFVPKPDARAYDTVIAQAAIAPAKAAMFDDIIRNLAAARALGMTTVWLNSNSEFARQGPEIPVAPNEVVDHETTNLADFLHSIRI